MPHFYSSSADWICSATKIRSESSAWPNHRFMGSRTLSARASAFLSTSARTSSPMGITRSPARSRFSRAIIAIAIGLLFFLTGLPVPGLIRQTVTHLANLNTPLAMFVTGVYLAQTKPAEMLHKPVFYRIALVKLLVIPLLTILILIPLPARYADLKRTLLIASACPTGTNIAVYAQLYDRDFGYAVETVTVTTLLSLVTLPLMVQLAERIW